MRWKFRLAERLGYKTVAELDRTMSNREYVAWCELAAVEHDEHERARMAAEDGR